MAAMLNAVNRLPPEQRRQIWLLVTTRSAQSCAMAMLAAGAANDLFLDLNGGDFARTQRLLSLIASTNTVADFVMAPIVGGAIDAFGRKYSLIFGQAIDCAVRLLVAVRPSVGTFFLYRLLREVARRMVIPSRAAMFGDYVGRGSEEYILITQLMAQVATLARTITLQIGSRSIRDGDFRTNFLVAAGFNLIGIVVSCFLSESLAKPLRKPIQMKKLANPVSFVGFFRRSRPLAALAPLLCVWELGSREFLPAQQYRRLKYGWTLRQQANMMLAYQICELANPFVLPRLLRHLGIQRTTMLSQRLSALCNINTAVTPIPMTNFFNPILLPLQHGYTTLDKVTAIEASNVGAGYGELAGAHANLLFCVKLVMPWVYGEIFARSINTFPGAPFLVAAILQLIGSEIMVPWAWRQLSTENEPTFHRREAGHSRGSTVGALVPRPIKAGKGWWPRGPPPSPTGSPVGSPKATQSRRDGETIESPPQT